MRSLSLLNGTLKINVFKITFCVSDLAIVEGLLTIAYQIYGYITKIYAPMILKKNIDVELKQLKKEL